MQRRNFALAVAIAATSGTVFAARKTRPSGGPASPTTTTTGDRMLQMQPMASTRADETHAVLAVSNQSFSGPYTFSGETRTLQQLRTPAPNPWEVSWVVWNFADDDHLCYFVLKPNGWEIGKRDPRYVAPGNDGQKIIATGESMTYTVGDTYRFEVRVNGAEADIYVNGVFCCHFKDTDSAPFYGGRVGLYSEDASCVWNNITAPFSDSFQMEPLQQLADGSQLTYWTVVYLGYGSGRIMSA